MHPVDEVYWIHIELSYGHQINVGMRHHEASSIGTEDFKFEFEFRQLFFYSSDKLIEELFELCILGIHLSLERQ
jgi:hypothetical protein